MDALNQLERSYKEYRDARNLHDSDAEPGGDIARQEGVNVTFRTRPATQFVNEFPDVATEAELAHTVWWWRFIGIDTDPGIVFPRAFDGDNFFPELQMEYFLDAMQESAFFYEFRARFNRRYKWDFGAPWPNCSVEKRAYLECQIPSMYPRKLWVSERPDTVWVALPKLNFALGDKTLLAYVKQELAKIRKAKGLPHPPPSKGARRRPLSWQPLELLDKKRYLGLVFNDSERNTVKRAHTRYLKTCEAIGLDP
jgi:hypothetical protein